MPVLDTYQYTVSTTAVESSHGTKNKHVKWTKGERSTLGQMVTEQVLPSRDVTGNAKHIVLEKATYDEDVNIRLLLLPGDAPPFTKSAVYLSSRLGSVRTELCRLPGAEQHFFSLYVTSCESEASITLPHDFRGIISIDQGQHSRIQCTSELYDRVRKGCIKVNEGRHDYGTPVDQDCDEVYVHAPGGIEFHLMGDEKIRPAWISAESRVHRLKRMLLNLSL